MPAKKSSGGPVKPNAMYTVKLNKAIKHGHTWLRPGSARVRISGATLESLGDAVESYQEVK